MCNRLLLEESTKENIEIITNDSEQQTIMEVTEAVVRDVESTMESVVIVEEEELNENTDVFIETEGEETTIPESEIENDIHTYTTTLQVLIPSSSGKQSSRRSTPSRPLCAADIENFLTQEQPQQINEQTVFSAIEQEVMVDEVEENEEDEDKENIKQPQEEVEVPMLKVKSIKSSSSGQAVKRLSSLYLPTKSTLARVAHETSTTNTMRPNTTNTNPFSGSQSLKSAMSNTGRSVASVASSVSMGHTNNHIRSAGYKSPQARGMCKNTNTKHHNKAFKKPAQPHAVAVAVRRGPTIPVTPHFRSDARSKMHYKERPLTTEEREIAAIEIARKMEELRMKKTKKVGVEYCVYVCDILSHRVLQYLLTYSYLLSQQTKPNHVRTSLINNLPLSLLSVSHIGLFDGQKSTS